MPRGFKIDITATAAAHFADKDSFVSLPKHTHGTEAVAHLILYGKVDVGVARARAERRAEWEANPSFIMCQKCGQHIFEGVNEMAPNKAHMRHILDNPWNRCWCDANLEMVCRSCHAEDHPDGRLG